MDLILIQDFDSRSVLSLVLADKLIKEIALESALFEGARYSKIYVGTRSIM